MTAITFTKASTSFWTVKVAGRLADIESTYAEVAEKVNGYRREGPRVTVKKKDGTTVEVELKTIVDSKVDGELAEFFCGFVEV
jgi:hypothetical protein